MKTHRAVIFDLDGTLIDSFPGIASAYEHVLAQLELGDVDDATLRSFVGPPIQEVLQSHFGLAGRRLEEGIRIFRGHYGTEGLFRFSKYRGVDEMLECLRGLGYELSIATSKLATMASKVVDHAGWSTLFNCVGGAMPDGSRHLKSEVIQWTLANMTPGLEVGAVVGDRGADITGARSCGIAGIGVTWGYGNKIELTEAGAIVTVDTPDAVPDAVSAAWEGP